MESSSIIELSGKICWARLSESQRNAEIMELNTRHFHRMTKYQRDYVMTDRKLKKKNLTNFVLYRTTNSNCLTACRNFESLKKFRILEVFI